MKMASWRSSFLSHRLQFHGRNATLIFDIYSTTLCAAFWPHLFFCFFWSFGKVEYVSLLHSARWFQNLNSSILEDKTQMEKELELELIFIAFASKVSNILYVHSTLSKNISVHHACLAKNFWTQKRKGNLYQ